VVRQIIDLDGGVSVGTVAGAPPSDHVSSMAVTQRQDGARWLTVALYGGRVLVFDIGVEPRMVPLLRAATKLG
jgi:hypothetical protein